MLAILPQIEQGVLYTSHNFNLAAWDAANATVVRKAVEVYVCPSRPASDPLFRINWVGGPVEMAYSSYVGNLGSNYLLDYFDFGNTTQPDGVLFRASHVRPRDIADGMTHTLLVGERDHPDPLLRPVWSFGVTGKVVGEGAGPLSRAADPEGLWGFSSHHPTGAHLLMADGSVGLASHNVDQRILRGIATRSGHEQEAGGPF